MISGKKVKYLILHSVILRELTTEESRLSVALPMPVLCVDIVPNMKGDPSSAASPVLRMTADHEDSLPGF